MNFFKRIFFGLFLLLFFALFSNNVFAQSTPSTASVTLTANPTEIWQGESSTLTWTSNNVTNCRFWVRELSDSVNTQGNTTITPTSTGATTYNITCDKTAAAGGGTISASATLNIYSKPVVYLYSGYEAPNLGFKDSAGNDHIWYNFRSVLTWVVLNADYCVGTGSKTGDFFELKNGVMQCSQTGDNCSFREQLTDNTTYTLTCTKVLSNDNYASSSASVNYVVHPRPLVDIKVLDPNTGAYTDNPISIYRNESVDIIWNAERVGSCVANFDITPVERVLSEYPDVYLGYTKGSDTQKPSSSLTYKLECSSLMSAIWAAKLPYIGSYSDSITVTVNPLPPPPSVTLQALDPADNVYKDEITITSGQSSQLKWNTEYVKPGSCVGTGFRTSAKDSGSLLVQPITTITYQIECESAFSTDKVTDTAKINVTQVTPTVTLNASYTTVFSGEATLLTWSSSNATSCTGTGFDTANAISNSIGVEVRPTVQTTYSINCTGPGGSASANRTINIAPNPTVDLKIDGQDFEKTINSGSSISISWSSNNVDTCTNNFDGAPTTGGSKTETPFTGKTYQISCSRSIGGVTKTVTDSIKVNVTQPVTGISLTANPLTIWEGDSTTLSWTTSNVQGCSIYVGNSVNPSNLVYDIPQAQLASGSINQTLTSTTNYLLACLGSDSSIKQTGVTVNVERIPTVSLTATPNNIWLGATSTISWSSSNATNCTTSSDDLGYYINYLNQLNGSVILKPTTSGSKTYNISCSKTINSNSTKTATASANLNVTPLSEVSVDLKVRKSRTSDPYQDSLALDGAGLVDLNWSALNASSCWSTDFTLNPGSTLSQTVGDVPVSITRTYTITCAHNIFPNDPNLYKSDNVVVTVNYTAPSCGPHSIEGSLNPNFSLFDYPSGLNACANGNMVSQYIREGYFLWECSETNYTNVECAAKKLSVPPPGDSYCGPAQNQFYPSTPNSSLCSNNSQSSSVSQQTISDKLYWTWTCSLTDGANVTNQSSCQAYIQPTCGSNINQCLPSGAVSESQTNTDTSIQWSCFYDYISINDPNERSGGICSFDCPPGQIVIEGACKNVGNVKINSFISNPRIVNKGDDCNISWEVKIQDLVAPNLDVECLLTGGMSGTHTYKNGIYQGEQTQNDIQSKTDYVLTCSVVNVPPVLGTTMDIKSTSCILNPDYREF